LIPDILKKYLHCAQRPHRLLTHPTLYSMGISSVTKRPTRNSYHSSPCGAKFVNTRSYPHIFMAWCLIKHRGSLTFTLWS